MRRHPRHPRCGQTTRDANLDEEVRRAAALRLADALVAWGEAAACMAAGKRIAPLELVVADARAAGFHVTKEGETTTIVRTHARTGRVLRGVVRYGDGWCFDATVAPSVARAFRGVTAIRSTLGL